MQVQRCLWSQTFLCELAVEIYNLKQYDIFTPDQDKCNSLKQPEKKAIQLFVFFLKKKKDIIYKTKVYKTPGHQENKGE